MNIAHAISCLAVLIATTPIHAQTGIWMKQGGDYANAGLVSVDCADSLHCMATGNSYFASSVVYRSVDGGRSWDTAYFQKSASALNIWEIAHPTPHLAVVSADSGIVLRTVDGGNTWNRVQAFAGSKNWRGHLSFSDSLNGAATAGVNYIKAYKPEQLAVTSDGGASWTELSNFRPPGDSVNLFDCIAMPSPTTILAVMSYSDKFLVRSADRGLSWSSVRMDTVAGGFARDSATGGSTMNFADARNGWMVVNIRGTYPEYRNIVFRTRDGGASWKRVYEDYFPGRRGITSLSFRDTVHGIAGTYLGPVFRTNDGGATWNADSVPTTDEYFINYKRGTPGVAVTGLFGQFYRFSPKPAGVSAPSGTSSDLRIETIGGDRIRVHYRLASRTRARMLLYNPLGQTVWNEDAGTLEPGDFERTIPLNPLPSGWYGVALIMDGVRVGGIFCR